ncbi:hypothetical protein T09_8276 [Trichinella sp. T9]|nr:hypothetical protein T09_8276 [Trichinella sp. T9]
MIPIIELNRDRIQLKILPIPYFELNEQHLAATRDSFFMKRNTELLPA